MALSGHPSCAHQCPLLGVKRTPQIPTVMSANDPFRNSPTLHFAVARSVIGIFHQGRAGKRPESATSELSGDRARERALPPLTFILILRIQGQAR
jgi:hypothetical protein